MNRHRAAGSILPARGRCLSKNCGTNLDIEDIEFKDKEGNLVYLDKVFSFNETTSTPLLLNLNTGGCAAHQFVTELTLKAPGCSFVPCTLEPNAVFTIENAFVVVEYFNTRPPGNISPDQVTVDGFPVDDIIYKNGQYVAKTANIIPRIQKNECLNKDLPTKVFFLIENAGPWDIRLKIILEGTVNTGGRNCRFCLVISNKENSCNIPLPNTSLSDFAIPDLSLPCSVNSIAPDIRFQFDANVELINPRLFAVCGAPLNGVGGVEVDLSDGKHHNHSQVSPVSDTCTVALVTTLAIEPVLHVETIRQTLFCVNACEAKQPCQGSVTEALAEEEEECNLEDIFGPDCRCRKRDREDVAGIRERRNCDTVGGIGSCETANDRTVGGVTIGVGDCDDCNNGNGVLGERFIRDRIAGERRNKDRVGGASLCRETILGERFDRGKDRVAGENICELLCEILDDVLGESCSGDVAGVCGLSPNGTWGANCGNGVRGISDRNKEDLRGIRDRLKKHRDRDDENGDVMGIRDHNKDDVRGIRDRDKERTAFQFNGCNGCSW